MFCIKSLGTIPVLNSVAISCAERKLNIEVDGSKYGGCGDHGINYCASPSSGDAYSDQQLTLNFWALSLNFLCADMLCEDSKTVSLFIPRDKISPWLRQYQSYSSDLYMIGEVFTNTTTLIGLHSQAIHKHLSWSQTYICVNFMHIYVSTSFHH